MKHTECLKIFALFGVLTVTYAFGPPNSPPAGPPGGTDSEDHIYPCWTSINCVYRDTDEHKRIEECLYVLDANDIQISLDKIDKNLKATDYKDVYDSIYQTYCDVNSERRKVVFDKMAQGAMEIYSMGCERRYPESMCDHFSHLTDCVLTLLEDLKKEGKCDIEEFEKKSS
ncbi:hypothetical protein NPIL_118371 [Nephila pilipes]|uniref:Uncharacterized protein n=1 Tax=Nephila pilipes TaxID=299642 RepID=A0A8X6P7S1_NEPPI|nr:hypothetical protein NPIL_118371 [Nephila pilipes]